MNNIDDLEAKYDDLLGTVRIMIGTVQKMVVFHAETIAKLQEIEQQHEEALRLIKQIRESRRDDRDEADFWKRGESPPY